MTKREGEAMRNWRDAQVEGNYYNKYEDKGFIENKISAISGTA
jgi:hypothetical protein